LNLKRSVRYPGGRISPDSLGPLRRIREDKDSFRAMMAEFNREV
jgi:hypothetical protein